MQALIADFELSEGIYSRAKIEDTDSVCLWLGANVMLEYSCDEVTKQWPSIFSVLLLFQFSPLISWTFAGQCPLEEKLGKCQGQLRSPCCWSSVLARPANHHSGKIVMTSLNDLSLHDSAMIIPWPHTYSVEWYLDQVTIARVFNWDVHQRRSKQAVKETWSFISRGQPMWLGQLFFCTFCYLWQISPS